ncbi:hypothetical protein AABM38_20800 [Heyndrickxia sp. MSNUG]|uniref:hypothetical protein n=1 Tax=Heyndrickxia sp. MSNUG TaxID=3136677 RepID=UPI003C2AC429
MEQPDEDFGFYNVPMPPIGTMGRRFFTHQCSNAAYWNNQLTVFSPSMFQCCLLEQWEDGFSHINVPMRLIGTTG